jgi:hypothetical protein
MALCVVEINDYGLRVARGTELVLVSPGYALVDKHSVEVGSAAFAKSRLQPLQSFNRFWHQLNEIPLKQVEQPIRHHADLAFAHLSSIYEQAGAPDETVFAVPGSYSTEQLALMLGVARACGFNVVGLVDAAVASAASAPKSGQAVHVEIHQHQTVLTWIDVDEHVSQRRVETIDDAGINRILDATLSSIADTFIAQSRFDPLHHATTEQSLYDELGTWLQVLCEAPEIAVGVEHQGRRIDARLRREDIVKALSGVYDAIVQRVEGSPRVIISERLARLPGFAERLPKHEALPGNAVFLGCQAHLLRIRAKKSEAGVGYLTRLPVVPVSDKASAPARRPAGTAPTSTPCPTHLLSGERAYPLSITPIYLTKSGQVVNAPEQHSVCSVVVAGDKAQVEVLNSTRVLINGRAVDGVAGLAAGDRIEFPDDGVVFTSIEVTGA